MTKSNILIIIVGLAISICLAAFISPYASSSPDGLEKVVEQNSLMEKADEAGATVWEKSPIADYTVPGIKNKSLATGLAGVIGTITVFIVCFVFAKKVSRKKEDKGGSGV